MACYTPPLEKDMKEKKRGNVTTHPQSHPNCRKYGMVITS